MCSTFRIDEDLAETQFRTQRNILVHNGEAVVADFGFARIEHDETRTLTAKAEECLSLRHLAPERVISAVKELRPTAAGDIYALSMTLLELGTLADPFSDNKNPRSVSIEAANGKRPEMPHSLGSLGPRSTKRLYGILATMWRDVPLQRPSAHKVVEDVRLFVDELTGSASVGISAPEEREVQILSISVNAQLTQSHSSLPRCHR